MQKVHFIDEVKLNTPNLIGMLLSLIPTAGIIYLFANWMQIPNSEDALINNLMYVLYGIDFFVIALSLPLTFLCVNGIIHFTKRSKVIETKDVRDMASFIGMIFGFAIAFAIHFYFLSENGPIQDLNMFYLHGAIYLTTPIFFYNLTKTVMELMIKPVNYVQTVPTPSIRPKKKKNKKEMSDYQRVLHRLQEEGRVTSALVSEVETVIFKTEMMKKMTHKMAKAEKKIIEEITNHDMQEVIDMIGN